MQAAEEAERARLAAEEARKAELVKAERQRLLREAAYLRDYLPKGVLHDMEDLRIMEETVAQQQQAQTQHASTTFGKA